MKKFSAKLASLAMACAMLLLADASQAHAWDCPAMMGNGYGPQMSPQQMEMAREIIGRNFANMDSTRQALAAKRAELDGILASPNPDGGRIEELSREIGELRGKMLSSRAEVRSQLAQKGLPPDFLGSNADPRDGQYYGGHRGGYHHDRRGYGWGGPRYGRGCGGCW